MSATKKKPAKMNLAATTPAAEKIVTSEVMLTQAPTSDAAVKAPTPRKAKAAKPEKLGALNAAAKVLAESGGPMTTRAMIEAMATKGYWTSPNGQTPSATLYSAIAREIKMKGKDARFTKADRGKFTAKA